MLSGDLRVALALLWYALFIKNIRDWGCQSHFMFFFHVFGPKNSEISRIFYTDILGMPETWPKMLQKPGFSVSHDKIWCFPTDLRSWDHFEIFWTTFGIFEISFTNRATKGSDPSPRSVGISRVNITQCALLISLEIACGNNSASKKKKKNH